MRETVSALLTPRGRSRRRCRRSARRWYRLIGRLTDIVNTESARKPRSSAFIAINVRTSRPAPESNSTAPATWPAASTFRSVPVRVELRPPEASACVSGVRAACHAGARPNSTPVSPVSAAAKSVMRASNRSPIPSGSRPGGTTDGALRNAAHESTNPAAPPSVARSTLCHEQPHDLSRAAADRGTDRHLARPADASCEQQVRDVGARHQQDERHDAAEYQRGCAELTADKRLPKRLEGDRPIAVGFGA
jgi:hypothetical protein